MNLTFVASEPKPNQTITVDNTKKSLYVMICEMLFSRLYFESIN